MFWIVCPTDMRGPFIDDTQMGLNKEDQVKAIFTQHDVAIAHAHTRAGKEPGRGFAVMAIERVYEAKQPTIITKKIDARNQLVLDDGNV